MKRITLFNAQQGHTAMARLWMEAKAHLLAGRRMVLELKEETRRDSQNRKFHALCGDLERSRFQWMGKPRTAAQWKVLLVSGHAVATKEETEVIPGLEGEFINVRESTAQMTVRRSASLLEYTIAFCAMNRIPTLDEEAVPA